MLIAVYSDSFGLTNAYDFSGTLPSSLGTLTSLRVMHFNNNALSGQCQLQSTLIRLNLLMIDRFDYNSYDLSGTLPSSWGTLTSLREMLLYNNALSG